MSENDTVDPQGNEDRGPAEPLDSGEKPPPPLPEMGMPLRPEHISYAQRARLRIERDENSVPGPVYAWLKRYHDHTQGNVPKSARRFMFEEYGPGEGSAENSAAAERERGNRLDLVLSERSKIEEAIAKREEAALKNLKQAFNDGGARSNDTMTQANNLLGTAANTMAAMSEALKAQAEAFKKNAEGESDRLNDQRTLVEMQRRYNGNAPLEKSFDWGALLAPVLPMAIPIVGKILGHFGIEIPGLNAPEPEEKAPQVAPTKPAPQMPVSRETVSQETEKKRNELARPQRGRPPVQIKGRLIPREEE